MSKPDWKEVKQYEDITFHKSNGVARIAFNRPEVRNAFRPDTLLEMQEAFKDAGEDPEIGVVLLTGNGPSEDGKWAFCAGGDQKVRGAGGYVGKSGVPRLNVLELQRYMRSMPKPVIALVAGYAIGGGHVLHIVSDLTLAADNAVFGQTGPNRRLVRRRFWLVLFGAYGWAETGSRDLVPLPSVLRGRGVRDGHGQQGRAAR